MLFFQNVPDAGKLLEIEPERLAGYVLEHLHTIHSNKSLRFHPSNLAAEISDKYPLPERERVSNAVRQGCQWLTNHDFIYGRTDNGHFDFTKKGEHIKTTDELLAWFNGGAAAVRQNTDTTVKAGPVSPEVNNFPRLPLSPEEETWLRAIYSRVLSGSKINPTEILVDLWDQIPEDFNYKKIDSRLIGYGVSITLLGILHVDPASDLVGKTDRVIRFIRDLIRQEPAITQVTASQIAEGVQIPDREASIILNLLRHLGKFWNGGSGSDGGMTSVNIDYEEVKREYLKYKGMDILIENLYKDKGVDEYGESTHNAAIARHYMLSASTPYEYSPADEINLNIQDTRNVFVVHGRNLEARNSLFRFLRSIGLRPLEWSQAIQMTGKASPFIGEILDVAFSKAQAVVVLLTPDDEARLREPFRGSKEPAYETELTGQARPNVLFEAGMAMGRNPDRTIIVELGTLRPFSDIAGRHTVKLNNQPAARQEVAQRLETAGCPVDLSGKDWHTEGDFDTQSRDAQMSSLESQNESEVGSVGLANQSDAYDESDIVLMIADWLRSKDKNTKVFLIKYSDIDGDLGFKPGTAKTHTKVAALDIGFRIDKEGKNTAALTRAPRW